MKPKWKVSLRYTNPEMHELFGSIQACTYWTRKGAERDIRNVEKHLTLANTIWVIERCDD